MSGTEEEFEKVFISTRVRVYSFLKRLIRDESLVQDCMQQTYMKLWEVFPGIDRDRDMLPLLYSYSRNCAIDMYRVNRKYVHPEDLIKRMDAFRVARGSHVHVEEKDERKILDQQINRMPLRRREVFRLIRLEGLSYRETAARLNISVSTVEKHIGAAGKVISRDRTPA